MKLLQINSVYGIRSTGRIVQDIHYAAQNLGWESHVIYGRIQQKDEANIHFIGNKLQVVYEMSQTAIFGSHAIGSDVWTQRIIEKIKVIQPDIIHLHNIHGFYLNIELLFNYLKGEKKQVVWTLHDCWSYTGHCAYYSFVECNKWETGCHHCPALRSYPYTILFDRSNKNYNEKKYLFNGLENCNIVTPSKWLSDEVKKSFLKDYSVQVIPNGIDLDIFKPTGNSFKTRFTILAVANIWEKRKGIKYCLELAEYLKADEQLVIIGLNDIQMKNLPSNVIGIKRTESVNELVEWYNRADVYINPTLEDNFPTTNLESLACGTPVVTFMTGGSVESVDDSTGLIVKRNTESLYEGIQTIRSIGKSAYTQACRNRVLEHYGRETMKEAYLDLYKRIIKHA